MQEPDDQDLARRAAAGDRAAFETLLLRHYDTMFRFACKWCGDRDAAQDITQDAAIRLARGIGKYDGRAAFTSWLYRLVVNCAIDWQRAQARHGGADVDTQDIAAPQAGADDALYARQMLAAVDALPEKQRTALMLVVVEGMSHAEAARVMLCKESTVSWHVHEARKALGVRETRRAGHG